MRPVIYPYKMGSTGAKAIQQELTSRGHLAKRVRPDGKYKPYSNHRIINWGCSKYPAWVDPVKGEWLNDPINVAVASDKLYAFEAMKEAGISIPEFTSSKQEAYNMLNTQGCSLVIRHELTGHSGSGIEMVQYNTTDAPYNEAEMSILSAPLYVKYIKKSKEFRVHVFKDKVIDIQQKRKRLGVPNEEINYQVRNHSNGWVYCRDDISADESITSHALDAVRALGLDFGAVDIIWNDHYQQGYVLEVNTAPGLEGSTVKLYVDCIEEVL